MKNGRPSRCGKTNEKRIHAETEQKEQQKKKEIREDEQGEDPEDIGKYRTNRVCHLSGKVPEKTERCQRQESDDRH